VKDFFLERMGNLLVPPAKVPQIQACIVDFTPETSKT